MKYFVFLMLAVVSATAAFVHPAAATTGKELYAACTANGAKKLDCEAYIRGFVDGMIMGYTAHGTARGYCPPADGIPPARGRAIVESWLHDHPERRGGDAAILAGLALAEAFPCTRRAR